MNNVSKHENEPMDVKPAKSWQEQFEEKLSEALEAREEPLAVVYYEEVLRRVNSSPNAPGEPVWEQFKNSFAFRYWEPEAREAADKLQQQWVFEKLKS